MNKIWKRFGLLKMFDTMEKTWLAKSARLTIVVTEKFTFKTKLLNAVAQLQSKS